ncbi:MAG: energy transducer TonB [Silvibacterium sp.]
MFEDSLVESTGRIRTRSRWYAIGSLVLEMALLTVLIFIPYLYPAALPKEALSSLLIAPPPPAAPASMPHAPATHPASPVQIAELTAPSAIPHHVANADDTSPTPPGIGTEPIGTGSSQVPGATFPLGSTPPPPVVTPPKPSGPIRVSAGVAAGHLLTPIQPVYPMIARDARIQGTVMIEAVISQQGFVEKARVVSGPPMLAQAALVAVNRARYQPYRLNGEPVEVETTINIIFTLDN